jgi:hypothetical protein
MIPCITKIISYTNIIYINKIATPLPLRQLLLCMCRSPTTTAVPQNTRGSGNFHTSSEEAPSWANPIYEPMNSFVGNGRTFSSVVHQPGSPHISFGLQIHRLHLTRSKKSMGSA